MKIDFGKIILDLHGKPALEPTPDAPPRTLTVGSICAVALLNADARGVTPAMKISRYRLAMLLVDGGEHDLPSSDLATISRCVGEVCSILAVGQVVPLLEGGAPDPVAE